MDTDHLSNEAYQAIIVEAGNYSRGLLLNFAQLASSCNTEKEYIAAILELMSEISEMDQDELWEFLMGDTLSAKQLQLCLKKISNNVDALNKIPLSQRHFEL